MVYIIDYIILYTCLDEGDSKNLGSSVAGARKTSMVKKDFGWADSRALFLDILHHWDKSFLVKPDCLESCWSSVAGRQDIARASMMLLLCSLVRQSGMETQGSEY